jgi:hypothetical protein
VTGDVGIQSRTAVLTSFLRGSEERRSGGRPGLGRYQLAVGSWQLAVKAFTDH